MKTIIAIAYLLLALSANAQIRFQKTFGGSGDDVGTFVKQTNDSGYLLCGATTSFGNGMYDVYVIKTDSLGNEQWSKTFGGSNDDVPSYAIEDSAGYVIGGHTASYGSGNRLGFLARLDRTGAMIWFKTYGTGSGDYDTYRFHKTHDNGFIISYSFRDGGYFKITLIKTDGTGTMQWYRVYGGDQNNVNGDVLQLPDSGFLVWAYTYNYGFGQHDNMFIRTDSVGGILWTKVFGNSVNEGNYSALALLKNDEAFTTSIADNTLFGPRDIIFIKINYLTGAILWAKEYGKAGKQFLPNSGAPTMDGGFATDITDQTSSPARDMEILRTDSAGNILWVGKYGGTGDDVASSLWNTKDNGFALVGYTTSFGAGGKDIYFVKTDANGISGCNELRDTLKQGDYTYQVDSPALPEVFPSNVNNSYSLAAADVPNENLTTICSVNLCDLLSVSSSSSFDPPTGNCCAEFTLNNPLQSNLIYSIGAKILTRDRKVDTIYGRWATQTTRTDSTIYWSIPSPGLRYGIIDSLFACFSHSGDSAIAVEFTWYDAAGRAICSDTIAICGTVGVNDEKENISLDDIVLSPAYPDPASTRATISFLLKKNEEHVSLVVTDVLGREVARPIDNETLGQGEHSISLDVSRLRSAIYFYTVRTSHSLQTRVLSVMK